jgi:hypothetical protein
MTCSPAPHRPRVRPPEFGDRITALTRTNGVAIGTWAQRKDARVNSFAFFATFPLDNLTHLSQSTTTISHLEERMSLYILRHFAAVVISSMILVGAVNAACRFNNRTNQGNCSTARCGCNGYQTQQDCISHKAYWRGQTTTELYSCNQQSAGSNYNEVITGCGYYEYSTPYCSWDDEASVKCICGGPPDNNWVTSNVYSALGNCVPCGGGGFAIDSPQ